VVDEVVSVREERQGDGLGHGAVAGGRGVEVVAAVEGGQHAVGLVGVARGFVKVDDGVEVPSGANPLVDGLAVGFAGGAGVVVARPGVGCDGRSDDGDAVGMGAKHDLLIGGEDTPDEQSVFGGRGLVFAGETAEVVDALEDDQIADAGLGEHVAVEAGEDVGAEAVGEQVVAADALVEDAEGSGGGRGLKPLGEDVGPAIVAVGGGSVAVGDGVAEGYDGGCVLRGGDIDCGDLVPVVHLLRGRQVCRRDLIAVDVVGRGAGAGMAGLAGGRGVEMEGDGEVGESGDGIVDGVGDVLGTCGNGDVAAAGEGERLVGGGVDGCG